MKTLLRFFKLPHATLRLVSGITKGLATDVYLVCVLWLLPFNILMAFVSSNMIHLVIPVICLLHILYKRESLLARSIMVKRLLRGVISSLGLVEKDDPSIQTNTNVETVSLTDEKLASIIESLHPRGYQK